jgi:hypothetical protein
MPGDGFEQSTILRTGPDGLTRVGTRRSWAERESLLVEALCGGIARTQALVRVPRESARVYQAGIRMCADGGRVWPRPQRYSRSHTLNG